MTNPFALVHQAVRQASPAGRHVVAILTLVSATASPITTYARQTPSSKIDRDLQLVLDGATTSALNWTKTVGTTR